MEQTSKKNRPGRPRKQSNQNSAPRPGISQQYFYHELNRVEFTYEMTNVFKKIASFIKQLEPRIIKIEFKTACINFVMYNSNNTTCIITINCKNVNRYYCRAPCHIFTNPLHIKHAFGKVNKTHNMFRMFLAENQFKMMLTNNTTDSNELYEIPIAIEEMEFKTFEPVEISKYKIKFELQNVELKNYTNSCVGDTQNDKIRFELHNKNRLIIKYINGHNNTILSTNTFKSPERIGLQTTGLEQDIFLLNVGSAEIKPIVKSTISDVVHISLDDMYGCALYANYDNETVQVKLYISV